MNYIGTPDAFLMARDLFAEGLASVEEAEEAGFLIAPVQDFREQINFWIDALIRFNKRDTQHD